MGMLGNKQATASSNKRSSTQLDFSNLGPLKPTGTVGYTTFRDNDPTSRKVKARKRGNTGLNDMVEDSDDEDDDDNMEMLAKVEDVDDKDIKSLLSPEDAKFQGELADGLGRIKVCFPSF